MLNLINKYSDESVTFRNGIYSDFDSKYLYYVVREYKPKTIIEFGPREGRTTSCIINAITKNLNESNFNVKYYIFEKDAPYLNSIKVYVDDIINKSNLQDKIQMFYGENIIDSPLLDNINNIDLLFIDANHDYILAKWYIEHLFNKVNIGGIIHIHDIYYDKNGNEWFDSRMVNQDKPYHPDFSDINVMRRLYPSIFDKYFDGDTYITKHESDIIEEFYMKNKDNVKMYSTLKISREINQFHNFNCSMYFLIKNKLI
jgi:Methyltransferase domain